MADEKNKDPKGMVPWEQTEEAMDLGDSHPEDDIWMDDEEGNVEDGGEPPGDSRITGEEGAGAQPGGEASGEAPEGVSEEGVPGQPQEGQEPQMQPQEGQEPQEGQMKPQEGQMQSQDQGQPQEPQEGQVQPQEGEEELSVDDPAQAQQLLQNLDRMDRAHLEQVTRLIWGDDYQPEDWMTDDYLREDVKGSLMDIIEGQGGGAESGEEEEE